MYGQIVRKEDEFDLLKMYTQGSESNSSKKVGSWIDVFGVLRTQAPNSNEMF